jgi:hypothetical protein
VHDYALDRIQEILDTNLVAMQCRVDAMNFGSVMQIRGEVAAAR